MEKLGYIVIAIIAIMFVGLVVFMIIDQEMDKRACRQKQGHFNVEMGCIKDWTVVPLDR